jgi:hypothetical protein
MKYDLNKTLNYKVGWLGDKGIEVYLWDPRIKFNK